MFEPLELQDLIHQRVCDENLSLEFCQLGYQISGRFEFRMIDFKEQLIDQLEVDMYENVWEQSFEYNEQPELEMVPMDSRIRDIFQVHLYDAVLHGLAQGPFAKLFRVTEVPAEPLLSFQETIHHSIWQMEQAYVWPKA